MTLNSLNSPPTDPGLVVIVIQRQGPKVICATFKYKRGHWFGCASGDKYTTADLTAGCWADAGWIESPLQPIYTQEPT